MQRVIHISESGYSESGGVVNLAHVFSGANRKYLPQVDKQGNAQLFTVLVKAIVPGTSANQLTFKTASTGYATKQAVKAWHKVWRDQFRTAGMSLKSLGPYGQNLRVALTTAESSGASSDVEFGSGTSETGGGEWTLTNIVTEPPVDTGDTGALTADEMHDSYFLGLTGSSQAETSTDTVRWDSVGVIESWINSRRKNIGLDGGGVPDSLILDEFNPLILARVDSQKGQEMTDEIRTLQAEEPPYVDDTSANLMTQATFTAVAGSDGSAVINVPCGLVQVNMSANVATDFTFELLGISDM